MKKLMNRIIRKMGRDNYTVDPALTGRQSMSLMASKACSLVRGFMLRPWLGSSRGFIFLGRGTKIRFRHMIHAGRSLTIGDHVEINALSKGGVTIGDNVSILRGTIIECTGVIRNLGESLTIGNRVGIAQRCFIQVRGKVVIEDNVIFGPGVSIFSESHNHSLPGVPVSQQGETRKGVLIREGSWIGANATILDGVTIGRYSIVAAGAVVTRDVADGATVAGVPASGKLRKVTEGYDQVTDNRTTGQLDNWTTHNP